MIKKAVVMRKHLEVNRKDKDGKFRLILVESRIHRLARYYKVSQDLCCSSQVFHVLTSGHLAVLTIDQVLQAFVALHTSADILLEVYA